MSLKLSVDQYIEMFDRLSSSTKTEMGEEDAATGGGASPTKRFDISSPKRGPANQLGNTKWRDSYPLNRGVANTLF